MSGLDIGITGLVAARKALEVIGNNIANASTEGYHRQDVQFKTRDDVYSDGLYLGQGVDFGTVVRRYDKIIEAEIGSQESTISQFSKELETLGMMEAAFGDLSTDTSGLITVIGQFFNSLHDLSVEPTNVNYQQGVLNSAQTLVYRFQNLGTEISSLQDQAYTEALSVVDDINSLSEQIAQLNSRIYDAMVKGDAANNVMDQREALLIDLQRLIGVKTREESFGVINVTAADFPVVMGTQHDELELSLVRNGDHYDFGLAPEGSVYYNTDVTGGKLGGLFNLRNNIVQTVLDDLNTLALAITSETNKLHVQGVGTAGSYTSLTGWTMNAATVGDYVPSVTDGGVIQARVTHADSSVTTHNITVNSTDTLTTIAADFDAISGLDAAVSANKLSITATDAGDPNCTFDFLPVSPTTDSDTSGFLAAVGINCFFSGTTAATMDITDHVGNATDGISHIAVAGTTDMDDNENVLAMAQLADTTVSSLDNLTPKEYYIEITTSIGSQIATKELHQETASIIWKNLSQQRDESSGVDMNEEATKMLTYESMFQAMAKYINTISEMMKTIMEISA